MLAPASGAGLAPVAGQTGMALTTPENGQPITMCANGFTRKEHMNTPSRQRPVLDTEHIHPAIRGYVASHHTDIVREVQAAVAAHPVVVVGMAQNPMPKRARKALDAAGIAHHYLEYGSYFNTWRRRNALKMWTGWPTFPMVFVRGVLVGGATDVEKLIASGELKQMLA